MRRMVATAVPDEAPERVATITGHDRCDRCGMQAYLRATLPNGEGGGLLMCAHHGREHAPALRAAGWYITDESDLVPA